MTTVLKNWKTKKATKSY